MHDPNLNLSQLDMDCDKQVEALWERARPGVIQSLMHTCADLRDLRALSGSELSLFVLTKVEADPAFFRCKNALVPHAYISLHVRLITWVRFFATKL